MAGRVVPVCVCVCVCVCMCNYSTYVRNILATANKRTLQLACLHSCVCVCVCVCVCDAHANKGEWCLGRHSLRTASGKNNSRTNVG